VLPAPPPLSPMATLRWQVVHGLLNELRPRRVLEVGCGQGGFGARIATSADYLGVEPDMQSFETARQRIEPQGGEVRLGTSDLVTADEHFDLICAFEVIEHLEDDSGALRDWMTHLDPGGSVIVSVPAWPHRFSAMDTLVGHYRRYTPDDLGDALRAAGCTEVRVLAYGWPLGFALEAVRNKIAEHQGGSRPDEGEASMQQRSATSGRLFQPKQLVGTAVRVGVAPFAALQRLRPESGTGLVAIGR
jgi:SAM-dependent methyltransferase